MNSSISILLYSIYTQSSPLRPEENLHIRLQSEFKMCVSILLALLSESLLLYIYISIYIYILYIYLSTLASALPKKTTSPTADREPPVGSNTAINKNNKRLLSSSPTTLTNDIKRANREFEHVAPKLDQLAHPNNNTTKNNKSPIKILSDELLRNFFSQLKDSDANPPPPDAPKTTYSQILQQEPEYSSPTRPAKLATMNQSSKPAPKKPTPLRASKSSSADMGPVVFNVKATVHTTPNHNPQGPALMDVSSPFHYKPEKTCNELC
ncbi:hypothetical protein WwAna1189 [Wolbachia endosymbiont of Drosophila ananassae]|nr:hypothetical protein WwAna1189 [Wolbachia endosymbiont of Drosophila ananassae]